MVMGIPGQQCTESIASMTSEMWQGVSNSVRKSSYSVQPGMTSKRRVMVSLSEEDPWNLAKWWLTGVDWTTPTREGSVWWRMLSGLCLVK